MKISIGSDHRGYDLKKHFRETFKGYEWHDVGCYSLERTDYPIYAFKVCNAIKNGEAHVGVLICGSGVGMAIAANRFKEIYAALCCNKKMARVAREDDGTNVLVIPSDFITTECATEMFRVWIEAQFKGGRYQARLDMIDELRDE